MVYGVSRIALPCGDWGDPLRANDIPEFVAGPENRLAIPALQRLLAGDDLSIASELFNPLVLFGSTGTGKSHLARGITRHWTSLLGDEAVEYLAAIDFARQLRTAREDRQLGEFRNRLAQLQLLVIEDLHRLPQRDFVQRELRGILDERIDAGAAVIVTTLQPLTAIAGLDGGLRDRLVGGLAIRLQAPGIEARQELLQLSADARGIRLTDEQLHHLAQKVEGTAPQVFRSLSEHELAAAGEIEIHQQKSPFTLKQIIAVVARYFSVTQAAMCSPARRKSLVYARGIAIHLARSLTDLSYAQIGQALGRRDHSTIMHASRTIEKKLGDDMSAQQDVEELRRILTAV